FESGGCGGHVASWRAAPDEGKVNTRDDEHLTIGPPRLSNVRLGTHVVIIAKALCRHTDTCS
ncbi:hypothetical protein KUCAC02_017501, partial [Chaenocephalus aceratus]